MSQASMPSAALCGLLCAALTGCGGGHHTSMPSKRADLETLPPGLSHRESPPIDAAQARLPSNTADLATQTVDEPTDKATQTVEAPSAKATQTVDAPTDMITLRQAQSGVATGKAGQPATSTSPHNGVYITATSHGGEAPADILFCVAGSHVEGVVIFERPNGQATRLTFAGEIPEATTNRIIKLKMANGTRFGFIKLDFGHSGNVLARITPIAGRAFFVNAARTSNLRSVDLDGHFVARYADIRVNQNSFSSDKGETMQLTVVHDRRDHLLRLSGHLGDSELTVELQHTAITGLYQAMMHVSVSPDGPHRNPGTHDLEGYCIVDEIEDHQPIFMLFGSSNSARVMIEASMAAPHEAYDITQDKADDDTQ
jgi:hypothetical protein